MSLGWDLFLKPVAKPSFGFVLKGTFHHEVKIISYLSVMGGVGVLFVVTLSQKQFLKVYGISFFELPKPVCCVCVSKVSNISFLPQHFQFIPAPNSIPLPREEPRRESMRRLFKKNLVNSPAVYAGSWLLSQHLS